MNNRMALGLSAALMAMTALTSSGFSWAIGGSQEPVSLEDVVVQGAAAKQVYEKNLLRYDIAEAITKACFAYAKHNDFLVAVRIVDQFGYAIYAGRMDGMEADNIDSAEMKAHTALYFREPTRVWMERSLQNPLMPHLLAQMGQFPVAGGLPIIVDHQLIGSIGVGGGPTSDQDEDCARAGLLQVLGPQPPYLVVDDNR